MSLLDSVESLFFCILEGLLKLAYLETLVHDHYGFVEFLLCDAQRRV